MIEGKFRQSYQSLLVDPLLPKLQSCHPNTVTWLSLFAGLLAAVFIPLNQPVMAIVLLWLSGYLDTLDGSLARFQKRSSPFGAALDIVSDRIVEFAIVLGLFLVSSVDRGLESLLMLGSILFCVTTFLVVGIFLDAESEKSFHYSPGLMERAEAFIGFSLIILFPAYFSWLAYLFALLVAITGAARLWAFQGLRWEPR